MTFSRGWKRFASHAIALTLALVSSASAGDLKYNFQGNVTSVFDPTGFFGSSVALGNLMSTSFTSTAVPTSHPIVDSALAYWTQYTPENSTSLLSAGAFSLSADNGGWNVQGYDSHLSSVEDRLTFFAFQATDYHDFAAFWQVALVGPSTEFAENQIRDDWTQVINPAEYSKMYIQLSVAKKIWEGDSFSFDFNSVLARVEGSVTRHEFSSASSVPVPEPSTYGFIGVLALGFIATRKKYKGARKG